MHFTMAAHRVCWCVSHSRVFMTSHVSARGHIASSALRRVLLGIVLLSVAGAPLAAQRADSVAVLEVTQTALRAISTRDTALAHTVFLPGAQLTAVMDPASPVQRPRGQADTSFLRTLPSGKPKLLERMWSPTVLLFGSMAQVHTPYDFHLDGKFSHCGTDLFVLVRSMGEWRISSITYTVQRTGCSPSPLGPPAT